MFKLSDGVSKRDLPVRPHYDFINDLSKNIIENEGHTVPRINKIPASPKILCELENSKIWALLDSGSQITAISENLHNKLKDLITLTELSQ